MIDLPAMQAKIGGWAEATFPGHTDTSIVDHLREEVGELTLAEIQNRSKPPLMLKKRSMQEEAADCLILLLTLAHRNGWNLAEAVAAKHAVNLTREWEADATGLSHHAGHEGV